MFDNLKTKLSLLEDPSAFNLKTFDELLAENVALTKPILSTEDTEWLPLESDHYMKKLRVLTLRQIHNQTDKKETVKQLLITTATKKDLDHLGAGENIFRDQGEYPYCNFEFKLLVAQDKDLIIPAGIVLNSENDEHKAYTVENIIIPAGEFTGIVKAELMEYIKESEVKTEKLITELTYAVEIKQLSIFKNGDTEESDERYRFRIISSSDRFSTAGSEEAYIFHAVSADSRIDDIRVLDEKVLDVNIYLASFDQVDEIMIKRVEEACNKKYVRPLGDNVIVKPADIIDLDINVTIEVFDLLKQADLDKKIRANMKDSFFIGQDFTKSDFIRKCHIDGVYRVLSDFEDVLTNEKQIIKISNLNIDFREAQL